jgi:peptide/nickel transport system substrate-binding protein
MIYVNNSKPYFKDTKVRQALFYGLNREDIAAATYFGFGKVANIPLPPVQWAYTEEGINAYKYDPAKANQLLDEAGWKKGADGIRAKDGVKFKVTFMNTTDNDPIVPIIQQNYELLGISVEPQQLDFNALMANMVAGNFDLTSVRSDSYPDPNEYFKEFRTGFTGNLARYSNAKVDDLVAKGAATINIDERKKIYTELLQELNRDPPFVFTNYRRSCYVYSSRLDDFTMDSFNGVYRTLDKMKVKKD